MDKREKIIAVIIGGIFLVSLFVLPSLAIGQIRILESAVEKKGSQDAVIKKTCNSIWLGAPHSYKGFKVYPMYSKLSKTMYNCKTLDESIEKGYLKVEEKKNNQVSQITVRNKSRYYILVLAGEIIKGGKQVRTISEDVIIPPKSKRINLSVFCVEKGRWSKKYGKFGAGGTIVNPKIRKGINAKSLDQSKVWCEVRKFGGKSKAKSSTGSLQDMLENKKIQADIDKYVKKLYNTPVGSIGMVVTYGKKIISLDTFANKVLYKKTAKKLLKGSVVVALGNSKRPKGTMTSKKIRAFIKLLGKGDVKTNNGLAGIGKVKAIDFEDGDGGGIEYKGRMVHMSAFGD